MAVFRGRDALRGIGLRVFFPDMHEPKRESIYNQQDTEIRRKGIEKNLKISAENVWIKKTDAIT